MCATWRLYPLWPQSIAHTSRHHGGVPLRASNFSASAASPIGSSFVFILACPDLRGVQTPFPATPFSSHPYKTPGVWGSGRLLRSSRHSGVWKGGEVREAFSLAPQVVAAQFAQRVADEFAGDFFAPGHVEIGVVERLGHSRGECGSLGNDLAIQLATDQEL